MRALQEKVYMLKFAHVQGVQLMEVRNQYKVAGGAEAAASGGSAGSQESV